MKHLFQTLLLTFGILTGFQHCSMPEITHAKFERDSGEVINDLKALGNFENAGIRWSASSFKEETISLLYVELTNGENLSEDDMELKKIGKEALKIVVNSIENEAEYDRFQAVFIQNKSIGLVSKSTTKPFEYNLEELE